MFLWTLSLCLLLTIIFYVNHIYTYWKRKEFPYLSPNIPLGNLGPVIRGKQCIGLNIQDLYKSTKERFIGIYLVFRPAILVRDTDLIKKILVTDFNHFHDRGIYCDEKNDPVSAHLLALPGEKWKTIRQKLSPTFSSGKIKNMLPIILAEVDNLKKFLDPLAERNEIVEINDILKRFALDILASVGFGIEVDSIHNPDTKIRQIEKIINGAGFVNQLRNASMLLCPPLLSIFKLTSNDPRVNKFFIDLIKESIKLREENNIVRKDFMQLLLQLRNSGEVNQGEGDDENWSIDQRLDGVKTLTVEQCAAQTLLFYAAGFDTTSSAIFYTLHELSKNPELLGRVREDIEKAYEANGQELTYECIKSMPLLELCILETVRKYPVLPVLNRECTKDYEIPDSNLTIEKGTPIIISLLGLSRDPEHFPEPNKYSPDRFTDNNYNLNAFVPFGDGPRQCIGLRMGKVVAKIGIATLLLRYNFEQVEQDKEIEFEDFAVVLVPKGGVQLKISKRLH